MFWHMSRSIWPTQIAEMARDGVHVVRADAPWAAVEWHAPVAGVHDYHWGPTDALVTALARRGLQWLPVAGYTAPWDASSQTTFGPNTRSAPAHPAYYADFVRALAGRYGRHGSFWRTHPGLPDRPISAVEIWSEENGVFWMPVNAARYARLYEVARTALHKVNPHIEAIVGGLVSPADQFVAKMYRALGPHGQIDAVAIHPYTTRLGVQTAGMRTLRMVLDAHGGVNSPIDVTEFGWPTEGLDSTVISDALRAQLMSRTIDTLDHSDCGIERITPYTWVTVEHNIFEREDWYGIIHPDGSPTLTGTAFAHALSALEHASPSNHASTNLCHRTLRLRLFATAARTKTRSRSRVKRDSHRRATVVRRVCTRLLVRDHGWPVSRAAITLTARGRRTLRRSGRTSAAGVYRTCFTLRRPQRLLLAASAQRWDFYGTGSALKRLKVR